MLLFQISKILYWHDPCKIVWLMFMCITSVHCSAVLHRFSTMDRNTNAHQYAYLLQEHIKTSWVMRHFQEDLGHFQCYKFLFLFLVPKHFLCKYYMLQYFSGHSLGLNISAPRKGRDEAKDSSCVLCKTQYSTTVLMWRAFQKNVFMLMTLICIEIVNFRYME